MNEPSKVFVTAVNIEAGLAALDNGDIVKITNMYDSNGEECDFDDAITAVAGFEGCWLVIDLRDFGNPTLN